MIVGVSAANQLSFCSCFNRCYFLNLHLRGFGVYICLKLAVLKTLLTQHPHCAGFMVPPPLHACTGSWWVLKDGVPGCFFPRLKVGGARVGRCFVPGAEHLLGVVCNRDSQLLQGLEWVEAQSWELMRSFLPKLQPPPLSLRADTQEVQSPVMSLLQSYCYPHWKFQHHCLY